MVKNVDPDRLEVTINDRAIDFWDSDAMQGLIAKLPEPERAGAFREYIAVKERLLTIIVQREADREGFWISAAKSILDWATAFGIGVAIREEEEDDGDGTGYRYHRWIELWYPR
jgi:hypothetical protein